MTTPIGPGAESVKLELYAPGAGTARWDRAAWDGGRWGAPAWQDVGCQVSEATTRWGAGDEAGVLSRAEAGELDLRTYDPDRVLDPLNGASPYYGSLRAGTPLRLRSTAGAAVATALLDTVTYDLAAETGRLRAIDGIAYLAQAQLPDGLSLPNTLRARVRAIVSAAGLGSLVPVQPEAASSERLYRGGAEGYPDANTTTPTGWRISGGAGTFGTSTNAHSGTRAYNARGSNAVSAINDAQRDLQRVVGGATYTFGAWRYRESWQASSSIVYLHWWDAAGGYISNGAVLTWPTSDLGDQWTYKSTPITFPANAATVAINIEGGYGNTGGSEWIDDISLVGPDPDTVLPADPAVAPYDGKARAAWEAIVDAGLDALTYVWLDPTGTLRFTPWGSLGDASLAIGCEDPAAPGGLWIEGIETLEAASQADGIRNSVRARASAGVWAAAATDPVSISRYGIRALEVDRVVPDQATWTSRILADRADAGLQVTTGEVRPYDELELAAILAMQQDGPTLLRIRDDAHGELVDLDVSIVGGRVGVTPAGWRFAWVTAIPRAEWESVEPAPPIPTPPADPWHVETRTYIATSDALLALTSGGSKYGAGASSSLPVGVWQGWTYRACIQPASIPLTKIRALRSATLKLRTTTQVRVGFGSSPTIEIRRITGAWSAGSSSTPSGGNAVVYPGPATTSSGAVRANVSAAQSTDLAIRIDAIARAWLPASAGGSSAAQRGVMLLPGSGSQVDTSEVWPVEQGGAARPTLELVLEVFD